MLSTLESVSGRRLGRRLPAQDARLNQLLHRGYRRLRDVLTRHDHQHAESSAADTQVNEIYN